MRRVLVAGASGLIGGHLVASLLRDGFYVRAVGKRPVEMWNQVHASAENLSLDLSEKEACYEVVKGVDEVYNLAANIGGVSFIEKHKAETMLSVLINTHLLMASRDAQVGSYFYASSHAVASAETPQEGKSLVDVVEDGHVWEKLFSEKLCKYFREDFKLETRIGRLQNVYGPFDVYEGGKERAPAALCRKAVIAKRSGDHQLEIWGDGNQKRSFLYVTDAVEGIRSLMKTKVSNPVPIGSSIFVTINELVDAVEKAAGFHFERKYNVDAPKGVERTVAKNSSVAEEFSWAPKVPLDEGIRRLYSWVEKEMARTEI